MSQDPILFDGTILDNVACFAEQPDAGRGVQCLRQAALEEFLDRSPQGINTPVGSRGLTLSGGQRQRIEPVQPQRQRVGEVEPQLVGLLRRGRQQEREGRRHGEEGRQRDPCRSGSRPSDRDRRRKQLRREASPWGFDRMLHRLVRCIFRAAGRVFLPESEAGDSGGARNPVRVEACGAHALDRCGPPLREASARRTGVRFSRCPQPGDVLRLAVSPENRRPATQPAPPRGFSRKTATGRPRRSGPRTE